MENKNDMQFELLFLEIAVVIIICIVILCRIGKNNNGRNNTIVNPEQVTATPTDVSTVTPTPSLSPTSTPVPTQTTTPTPTPVPSTEKKVSANHTFKPYTRYTAYNVRSSQQYKLQQIAVTAENGIRVVLDPAGNWRYCVALGTYWCGGQPEHIGRCVDVYMVNGAVLHCVLADVKKQQDTKGGKNKYGEINNDLLEFVVDEKQLAKAVKECGNVSKAGTEFEGDIEYMIVYDMWIEGFGKE